MEIKLLPTIFFHFWILKLTVTIVHQWYGYMTSKGGKKWFCATGDKAKLSAEHRMYDRGVNMWFLTATVLKTTPPGLKRRKT